MYNYIALLVKYTLNEKLQLNKLKKIIQLFYNYSQSISELCCLDIERTISIYFIYTVNSYGNSNSLNVLYEVSIIIYQNMSPNCLIHIKR